MGDNITTGGHTYATDEVDTGSGAAHVQLVKMVDATNGGTTRQKITATGGALAEHAHLFTSVVVADAAQSSYAAGELVGSISVPVPPAGPSLNLVPGHYDLTTVIAADLNGDAIVPLHVVVLGTDMTTELGLADGDAFTPVPFSATSAAAAVAAESEFDPTGVQVLFGPAATRWIGSRPLLIQGLDVPTDPTTISVALVAAASVGAPITGPLAVGLLLVRRSSTNMNLD